eukprot:14064277-Ditylum_brightwellii.AAC.1
MNGEIVDLSQRGTCAKWIATPKIRRMDQKEKSMENGEGVKSAPMENLCCSKTSLRSQYAALQ